MRQRLLLPALLMVMIVTALVSGLGTPLIPQMVTHYRVSLRDAQWVLTLPMLVGAVLSPLIGRLGSPGRRRPLLLVSLSVVSLGLLLSALPAHEQPYGFALMLVGRALQGVGLALAPIAMSITSSVLEPERALPAIAILSSATIAAAGFAFPLSSLFAGIAGLQSVYWVGVVLALMTLGLVWYAVPRSVIGPTAPIDWWGALILAGGSGALLLLLSALHSWGPLTLLAVALGSTVLISWWVLRSLRVASPLIDLRLAASQQVGLAHLTIVLAGTGTYLIIALVMIAGQDDAAAGLPALFTGFFLLPYSIFSVLGARFSNQMRGRIPAVMLMLIGTGIYVVSSAVLMLWHGDAAALFIGMAIAGAGSGCVFAVAPQLIVQAVPQEAVSSALSFNMLLRYIGFSAGSALCPVLIAVAERGAAGGAPGGRGDGLGGGLGGLFGDSYTLPFFVAGLFFAGAAAIILLRRRSA